MRHRCDSAGRFWSFSHFSTAESVIPVPNISASWRCDKPTWTRFWRRYSPRVFGAAGYVRERLFRAVCRVCRQTVKMAVARPSPVRYFFPGLRMLGRWAFSGESRKRPFEFQGKTFQPLTMPPS